MRSTRVLLLLAAAFLTQSVMAQPGPPGDPAAFGELAARVDALEAQVQDLEDNAPNPSVVGRTYCHVVDRFTMSGEDFSATERLVRFIIRRAYTFLPDLTFFADFKSAVFQFQDDNGRVVQFLPSLDSPLLGSYEQVGNRLDMVFSLDTGRSVTMYVSKDGSVIHGTLITHRSDFDEQTKITETFGVTRHWVLIEKGDNECLGEIIQ